MSGHTGGNCRYHHPKVCDKYKNGGKKACSGNCNKWHPPICYSGLNTGKCFNSNCHFWHGKKVARKKPSESVSTHASHDYHIAAGFNQTAENVAPVQSNPNQQERQESNRDTMQHFLSMLKEDMVSWKNQMMFQVQELMQQQYQTLFPPVQTYQGYHNSNPHNSNSQNQQIRQQY